MTTPSAKILMYEAQGEEYIEWNDDVNGKTIMIDGGDLYFIVQFDSNQNAIWNMLKRQAQDSFGEPENILEPINVGDSVEEITYTNEAQMPVLLFNEYIDSYISMEIQLPVSCRAIDDFINWTPSIAGCCKKMEELVHLGLAERSIDKHFVSGGVLGGFQ